MLNGSESEVTCKMMAVSEVSNFGNGCVTGDEHYGKWLPKEKVLCKVDLMLRMWTGRQET